MLQTLKDGFKDSGFLPALYGFGASVAGIYVASIFFEEFLEMAATGLTALSLTVIVNSYLENNRESIWDKKDSPTKANALLTARLSGIFVGIFLGAIFLQIVLPEIFYAPDLDTENAYQNEFLALLKFNFTVLFGGTIFSLLYRAGGLVTILAWNALHWSNAISSYVYEISESVGIALATVVSISLIPHLLTEAIAYVLGGMVGIFISRALFKYKLLSDEFSQVAKACVSLLLIAAIILTISVTSEIFLAQFVFHRFS